MAKNVEKGAKGAEKNVNTFVKNNKKATATEKAAAKGEKYAQQQAAAAERAAKKAAAKSALSYQTYGVIKDAINAPFPACKRFYVAMQSACGGALDTVVTDVIGHGKNEFAKMYADRVAKRYAEKGLKNYTDFLVWSVLWEDLREYTCGKLAQADPATAKAIEELRKAVEARKAAK